MEQTKIFCSYAPGAGKTTIMLQEAAKKCEQGLMVSYDYIWDSQRTFPISHLLSSTCFAEEPCINPNDIVRRKPDISVIDELLKRNMITNKPLYNAFSLLLENKIAIYSTVNLFQVLSLSRKYECLADVDIPFTVDDHDLLSLGKLIFVDVKPDVLYKRYRQPELFPSYRLEFSYVFRLEILAECRRICMEFLSKLDADQYEIVRPQFLGLG